jgi:hypothetical protein
MDVAASHLAMTGLMLNELPQDIELGRAR